MNRKNMKNSSSDPFYNDDNCSNDGYSSNDGYGDDEEIEMQTDVAKCESCGADMVFNPATQELKCEHCGSVISFKTRTQVSAKNFDMSACDTQDWRGEAVVYVCNNCGSKEILNATDMAKVCPFCGASNVVRVEQLPGLKPGAVFPFTVSKDECIASVRKWLKKRWFVPTKFKKMNTVLNTNGVYSPVWVFNAQTRSTYVGRYSQTYTVSVGSGENRRCITRVRYFNVSGVVDDYFDYLPIEASPIIDKNTFEKLRPFAREKAVGYAPEYLAGFSANHYDKDVNTAFVEARDQMESKIRCSIISKYMHGSVVYLNVNTNFSNVGYKYTLFPIWVGNYHYKEKLYNFYVNGNSAKVVGKVPRSGWKIFRFGFILAAIGSALYTLYHFFGHLLF